MGDEFSIGKVHAEKDFPDPARGVEYRPRRMKFLVSREHSKEAYLKILLQVDVVVSHSEERIILS